MSCDGFSTYGLATIATQCKLTRDMGRLNIDHFIFVSAKPSILRKFQLNYLLGYHKEISDVWDSRRQKWASKRTHMNVEHISPLSLSAVTRFDVLGSENQLHTILLSSLSGIINLGF